MDQFRHTKNNNKKQQHLNEDIPFLWWGIPGYSPALFEALTDSKCRLFFGIIMNAPQLPVQRMDWQRVVYPKKDRQKSLLHGRCKEEKT